MEALGCPETPVITNLRCAPSQKSEEQNISCYNPTSVLCAHVHVIASRPSTFYENN